MISEDDEVEIISALVMIFLVGNRKVRKHLDRLADHWILNRENHGNLGQLGLLGQLIIFRANIIV